MRLSSGAYLFKQGLKNIWTNRIMSVATFAILTVSLLMIGFSIIFSANINSFITDIEGKNEVIIFLSDDADEDYITELGEKLKSLENVSSVSFYSKEEAFKDIKKDMADAEDIFGYLGEESPLPDAYRIRIKDISSMSSTLYAIGSFEHIEKVKAPYDFVNVLTGLRTIVAIVSILLLLALAFASIVIITNATRASVDIRKREIHIMRYVGATNFFIKVPFFVEGIVIGVLSGAVAGGLTWLGYDSLTELLSTETTLFAAMGTTGFIPIDRFAVYMFIAYIIVGALICSIITVFSTRKYVKV